MTLPGHDIAIEHLRVRATLEDARELAREFETTTWPAQSEREWLFVRRLSVKGKREALRQQTSRALDDARHRAVHGGDALVAQANAVRFANLPEMIAFLLRDLANGDAVFRWYWQHWAYLLREPKGNAIARVLWEHTDQLADIVEQLDALHQLEKIWQTLNAQAADVIADKLFATLGPLRDDPAPSNTSEQAEITAAVFGNLNRISTVPDVWAPVLRNLPMDDARVRLASAVVGLSHFPLLLARHPQAVRELFHRAVLGAQWLGQTGLKEFVPATTPIGSKNLAPTRAAEPKVKRQRSSPHRDKTKSDNISTPPTMIGTDVETQGITRHNDGPLPTDSDVPATGPVPTERLGTDIESDLSTGDPTGRTPTISSGAAEHDRQPDRDAGLWWSHGEFHTGLGGAFLLINALSPFSDQLAQSPGAAHQGAGFGWLFELLRRFDCAPDYPLFEFLARQCGLDDADALLSQPPIEAFDAIHTELKARHDDIWDSQLIEIPGIIVHSASHIDCFLPLSSVRLPVRLSGLDIDPGWIPWLGRVVAFHYRDSLHGPPVETGDGHR